MTLTEQETFVKNLIAEDVVDANSNTGLFTQAQLDQFIDQANQKWYRRAVAYGRALFATRSADKTYSATTNLNGYDYSSTNLDTVGVHEILSVYNKVSGQYFFMQPFSPLDRERFEPASTTTSWATQYYLEAEKIVITPAPNADQTLQIVYVPRIATITASVQCLGGKLTDFHPVVGYEAALSALRRDGVRAAAIAAFKSERDAIDMELKSYMARRQNPSGRKIRHVEWD